MADLPDAGSALYQKLKAATALTSLVGGTASPRIYERQAPSEVARPYVIQYLASGVMPNQSPREDINWVFRVEAVGETAASAAAVQNQIYTALHQQTLTLTGWGNYRTTCERVTVLPVENVNARQYWRRVGDYRVRASKD